LETERRHEISKWIKARASELGFAACGISGATFLESEKERLNNWLLKGYHGEMSYMARDSEKRLDPVLLMPGARSVISVLMNYFQAKNPSAENNYKIAKYAYGKDYHLVIQEKLNVLIKEMKDRAGECQARAFTDSGPVMDKAWAERASLG
jgi:epoxyqueuosine reductase